MSKKVRKPDTKKDNSVGNKINQKYRRRAKKNILKAFELEELREEQGYKWVFKDKTQKLVHPDKIENLLKEGWCLTKK